MTYTSTVQYSIVQYSTDDIILDLYSTWYRNIYNVPLCRELATRQDPAARQMLDRDNDLKKIRTFFRDMVKLT